MLPVASDKGPPLLTSINYVFCHILCNAFEFLAVCITWKQLLAVGVACSLHDVSWFLYDDGNADRDQGEVI